VALMQATYGRGPAQLYYFGGSEGGREGLTMAQRFPADYDGIVSVVPVIGWTGLFHAFVRHELPQFSAWLPAAKTSLIARAVADDCDALDGLKDGVINNYPACPAKVNLAKLRCAAGQADTATGLTDGELAVAQSTLTPYELSFPLANGLTRYPAWLPGHEDALDGPNAVSLVRWLTGSAAPTVPPNAATAATQWLYGSNWVRHAIVRNAGFEVRGYRPEDFRERVQQTSALMDSTHPDLSAFFARGGKLILRENGADRAQSPAMGFEYHRAVVAKLGADAVAKSMRLYVSPGSTHTGNSRAVGAGAAVPTLVDLLDPLDRWVTQGQAPADALVQTAKAPVPPFEVQASRPLCRYPAYPHFTGSDGRRADSYTCRTDAR
jgi:feruloyl esterase